jgi:hypothetical protein
VRNTISIRILKSTKLHHCTVVKLVLGLARQGLRITLYRRFGLLQLLDHLFPSRKIDGLILRDSDASIVSKGAQPMLNGTHQVKNGRCATFSCQAIPSLADVWRRFAETPRDKSAEQIIAVDKIATVYGNTQESSPRQLLDHQLTRMSCVLG